MTGKSKDKPKLTVVNGTSTKGAKSKGGSRRSAVQANGLTVKQEAFALAVYEGSNFSEAYRSAYDTQNMSAASIHREACLLIQNPKVSQRVESMQRDREREQRMQSLSRSEKVISKLEEIALRGGDADGTQVRALELLGKQLGLWREVVETVDKTERSADEIEAALRDRLKALGV